MTRPSRFEIHSYGAASKASSTAKLYDAYIQFFRWATNRLEGRDGIICFVTNNGFLSGLGFDGFRKHLMKDFQLVYHFDFKGNARTSGERRRAEGGNIFNDQIRTGVGITMLIRNKNRPTSQLLYHSVKDYSKALEKTQYLRSFGSVADVPWKPLISDARGNWLENDLPVGFDEFLPIGTKEAKEDQTLDVHTIFKNYSIGANTNRDAWMYDFSLSNLSGKANAMVETYNSEVKRWKKTGRPQNADDFVLADEAKIKWSSRLKECLLRGLETDFDPRRVRKAIYRPFTHEYLYFDNIMTHRQGQLDKFLPTPDTEKENLLICVSTISTNKPFHCLVTDCLPDLHLTGDSQCFPLYTYALDGKLRRDNVTDWALSQFRDAYGPDVTKRDIFHYVYALLHHPQYRAKYAENLKRELPRVPLVGKDRPLATQDSPLAPNNGGTGEDADPLTPPELGAGRRSSGAAEANSGSPLLGRGGLLRGGLFHAFADSGAKLAALHVGYEDAAEYPLRQVVNKDVPASLRVTKMRLTEGKTAVQVNDSLTLAGVPPETFQYRLGNRSALEWVLDQYQVTTDKRSGLVSDPNRPDDPAYIARLVRKVVTVSLETVQCINALPPLGD